MTITAVKETKEFAALREATRDFAVGYLLCLRRHEERPSVEDLAVQADQLSAAVTAAGHPECLRDQRTASDATMILMEYLRG